MAALCEGLDFSFRSGEPLFSSFDLEVEAGETLALLGPSGCGKTTLLRLIAGLLPLGGGRVDTASASFVFQEPRLFPFRSLLDNVALPQERLFGLVESRIRARRFLGLVGLADRERAFPDELSGGQRQRAALARAFAYPAPLILMDEPFQSLDLPLRIQLMDTFKLLLAQEPRTALVVTHDPREAIYLADRVAVLGGRPAGIVLDERIGLGADERGYASTAGAGLEARLFAALSAPR